MTTIRRTYAYLLAFAGMAMLSLAAANLLQVLLDVVLQAPLAASGNFVRDSVSRDAAVGLVGVPVWAIHWWWIERSLRDPTERASSLRRLYLYAILAASALAIAFSARESLTVAVSLLGGQVLAGPAVDVLVRPLAFTAIGALVWAFHWRVAWRDRELVGETGGSATLRRWYVYGVAFIGFTTLFSSVQELVESLWTSATQASASSAGVEGASQPAALAFPSAGAIVGLGLWLAHWAVLPERLTESARQDDARAVLRSVYLFLALTVGVAGALAGLSQLLYYAVARGLGVERPGGVGGNLLQAAAGPASIAIVYGLAWAYQRHALRRQAAIVDEAPRQAGIRRLYTYLVALVALVVLAAGVAGLLWTLGDLVVNDTAATTGDTWRSQIALFSTMAVVGLPVWLLHWRANPAEDAEIRSLARRLYVYLSLIAAMLSLVASLAVALYRLISLLLGETSSVDVLTDLAHAAAAALVGAAVAAYHWRVLRADARRGAPTTAHGVVGLVEIRADDRAALDRALETLRATGVQVTTRTTRS